MWYVHVHIPGEGQQGTAAAEGGTAAAEAGTAAAEGGTAASQEEDSWGPAVAREEDRSISLTPQLSCTQYTIGIATTIEMQHLLYQLV